VEKCYQFAGRAGREEILREIFEKNEEGISGLETMMKDQFANYVVQKILDVSDEHQRGLLIEHIRPHMATLRKFTYGKHIITRIEKILGQRGGNGLA